MKNTTTLKRLAIPSPTKYRIATTPKSAKPKLTDKFGKYSIV